MAFDPIFCLLLLAFARAAASKESISSCLISFAHVCLSFREVINLSNLFSDHFVQVYIFLKILLLFNWDFILLAESHSHIRYENFIEETVTNFIIISKILMIFRSWTTEWIKDEKLLKSLQIPAIRREYFTISKKIWFHLVHMLEISWISRNS